MSTSVIQLHNTVPFSAAALRPCRIHHIQYTTGTKDTWDIFLNTWDTLWSASWLPLPQTHLELFFQFRSRFILLHLLQILILFTERQTWNSFVAIGHSFQNCFVHELVLILNTTRWQCPNGNYKICRTTYCCTICSHLQFILFNGNFSFWDEISKSNTNL